MPSHPPTTFLVVEDNDTLRGVLRQVLERPDRELLLAADAESALAVFRHHDGPLDVVIADVHLPRMDGVTLAEELRRRDPAIAVVLVSGSFDDVRSDFIELEKPYTLDALEASIADALRAAASLRAALASRPLEGRAHSGASPPVEDQPA
jgi:DNA-binding NtrC family response regulator